MATVSASSEIPHPGGKRHPHSPVDEIIPEPGTKRQKVDDVENLGEEEIEKLIIQYKEFSNKSDGFIVDEELAKKIPKEKYEVFPYPFPAYLVGDGHPSKARSCAVKCMEYYNKQEKGRNFQFSRMLAANVTNWFSFHYFMTVEAEDRSVTAPYPVHTFRVLAGAPTSDENSPIEPRFLLKSDNTLVFLKEPPYTMLFEDYQEDS
ncbi:hypothetical protein Tsubulata_024799 [Turnera subulata]|uniref:Uncharacterized protein n=1 Tax=Turnera subulata TaxID=218843 RepID=A0A9Q0J8M1_9ROSI|nr:hypothetical protein Tsubulata_024799 [Turnera subulata]